MDPFSADDGTQWADLDSDGSYETALVDTTGDGMADAQYTDTNADGIADIEQYDTDADGVANVELVDVDHDGLADVELFDTNADGVADITLTANTTETGGGDLFPTETDDSAALFPEADAGSDPVTGTPATDTDVLAVTADDSVGADGLGESSDQFIHDEVESALPGPEYT